MPAPHYRFGSFALIPARRALLRDGVPIALGGRAFDLLVILVQRRDRVVSQDELLRDVWQRAAVEPHNLRVTISALRRALGGTDTTGPVQTVPGRGYQFVASVTESCDGADGAAVPAGALAGDVPPPEPTETPSIAVLPFANLTGDPAQDFFGDGLAEDIIAQLSRNRWLTVIARNSSFSFRGNAVDSRDVAQQFNVRYVLDGSVRQAGARVRVSARLIDATTSAHVTAVRYDRELTDIFAAQDDICHTILTAIRPAIHDAERGRAMRKPLHRVDAWAAYQRGMWHAAQFEQPEYQAARVWFGRAIAADPLFAPGHYGLGLVLLHDGSAFVPNAEPDWQPRGEALARRAIALDPQDSSAYAVLGLALMVRGEHAGALDALDTAIGLNPSDAAAHHTRGATLLFTGRPAEGLAAVETSLRLSPRDPRIRVRHLHMILGHLFNDDLAQAEAVARTVLRRWVDYPPGLRLLSVVLAESGQHAEARATIARAVQLQPAPFDDFSHARMPWFGRPAHRRVLAALRRAGWTGKADDGFVPST